MINIKLPDGNVKEVESNITAVGFAETISKSLSKETFAIKINGILCDSTTILTEDCEIEIITKKSDEYYDIMRHDFAHILGQAVQEVFPGAKLGFGPTIEDGFYYDFDYDGKISIDDFPKIEKKMREIIKRAQPFVRKEISRDDAIELFDSIGENLKTQHIKDLPEDVQLTCYSQGDWVDLCRGPHGPGTNKIGDSFKLTKISGAYFKGDANGTQMQRIYGTAWKNKDELESYLTRIEEAEKRDHRKLGKELDLFHLQEEAQGSIFWHPNGWTIYKIIENYIRAKLDKNDYKEVRTPQIVDNTLWEKSGHWEKFREAMFVVDGEEDGKKLAIKPMNCPCHVEIFKKWQMSYKNLPYRMAEFGSCHRNEPSGALHGIMRVRGFTQDDAHIFCTKEQIVSETLAFCNLLSEVYEDFGFTDIKLKFSDRPEVRAGTDEIWDDAEASLKEAIENVGIEYTMNKGEGAFYGPKLEFVLVDALGRDWQCGTLQVDFVLPERLGATYIGEDGEKHHPVMLHRAILGSFERFIGILIEHHAGKLPIWLSPIQVALLPIVDDVNDYAYEVKDMLLNSGIRCIVDDRSEKVQYKIRENSLKKIPLLFVVGKNERDEKTVAIRRLGSNQQEILSIEQAIENILIKEQKN